MSERTIGIHCPTNLFFPSSPDYYRVLLGPMKFDDQGYQVGERINGYDECPKCGLWWPVVETPDEWQWAENRLIWSVVGWWGAAQCVDCNLLLVTQPDGTAEAYRLGT